MEVVGMNYRRHVYCVLLSAIAIVVTMPFHPGIPWAAWSGAFIFFAVEAEILFAVIDGRRGEGPDDVGRRDRSRRMIIVAGVMAVILVALWSAVLMGAAEG